jgi:predicted Zn-dependent protease
MKRYLFVALLFANIFLACSKLPKLGPGTAEGKLATASEDDCGFVQNNYGQRVSWKQSLPIKMYIDPTYPQEYETVLRDAAQKWEDVVGRTLFVFERATQATTPGKDSRNIVYWVSPWSLEQSLEAMTSLSWMNNQLTEADLKVDAQYFNFFVDTPATNKDVHLQSLLVHELGHVLGLKHVGGTSVMVTVLDYLMKRDVPTEDDKAHIKCEYN